MQQLRQHCLAQLGWEVAELLWGEPLALWWDKTNCALGFSKGTVLLEPGTAYVCLHSSKRGFTLSP